MKVQEFDFRQMALVADILKDAVMRITAVIGKEPNLRLIDESPPVVSDDIMVDLIMQIAASMFNISVADLKSASRKKPLPDARGVAMIGIRTYTQLPFKKIGLHFGGRDHSTVMVRIAETFKLAKREPELDNKIYKLLNQIELLSNYDVPKTNT